MERCDLIQTSVAAHCDMPTYANAAVERKSTVTNVSFSGVDHVASDLHLLLLLLHLHLHLLTPLWEAKEQSACPLILTLHLLAQRVSTLYSVLVLSQSFRSESSIGVNVCFDDCRYHSECTAANGAAE